ncbi:MAG TPA: tetratricopeptide repeat protein, partial [Verrucomicrobiae bacterium]|nr:tetratricopeptide repeat protein [Verrucomicrobiae bacterium]
RQRDYPAALRAFRAALAAYPNDPRALFGLSLALQATGDASGAAQAGAAFETVWAGADTILTPDDL